MAVFSVKLEKSGRILLPAEVRRKLSLKPGEDVLISANDDTVTVIGNRAAAIRRVQQRLRVFAPGRILSEELIAERRAEAEKGKER